MLRHRPDHDFPAFIIPAEIDPKKLFRVIPLLDMLIEQIFFSVNGSCIIGAEHLQGFFSAALNLPVVSFGIERKDFFRDLPAPIFYVCRKINDTVTQTCHIKIAAVFPHLALRPRGYGYQLGVILLYPFTYFIFIVFCFPII